MNEQMGWSLDGALDPWSCFYCIYTHLNAKHLLKMVSTHTDFLNIMLKMVSTHTDFLNIMLIMVSTQSDFLNIMLKHI